MLARLTQWLMLAMAAVWPLEVFQYIPFVNAQAFTLLAFALCACLVVDMRIADKLRVPFEMLWPIAILAALLAIATLRNTWIFTREVPEMIFVFAAAIHFANNRALIGRCLWVSSISAAAAALITLLAAPAGLAPTAYSLDTGLTLTFAYDMASGGHILLMGCAVAAYFSFSKDSHPIRRAVSIVCAATIGLTLAVLYARALARGWTPATLNTGILVPESALALALVAWLFVRVVAKIEVDRREKPDAIHALFLLLAAATVLSAALSPLVPRLYQAFLLGLACGYTLPQRPTAAPQTREIWLAPGALALIAINVLTIFPQHTRDPRNYHIAAYVDYRQGQFHRLLRRMDVIENALPNESRAPLWKAYAALALKRHEKASVHFATAMRRRGNPAASLPPPPKAAIEDFLVRLRDYCSDPELYSKTVAYERALIAAGDRESALQRLRLRLTNTEYPVDGLPLTLFAQALAAALSDPELLQEFRQWRVSEIASLLQQTGARFYTPPTALPTEHLPLIAIAQRTAHTLEIRILSPQASASKSLTLDLPPVSHSGETPAVERPEWGEPLFRPDQTSSLALTFAGQSIAQLRLMQDQRLRIEVESLPGDSIPYGPVIAIWLP